MNPPDSIDDSIDRTLPSHLAAKGASQANFGMDSEKEFQIRSYDRYLPQRESGI